MKTLMSTSRRALATGVAGVLVAGGAALVAAPAQAADAPVAPHLDWRISTQFVEHLFLAPTFGAPVPDQGVVSDGAQFVEGPAAGGADDTFLFPQVSVTRDGAGVTRSYAGTVAGSFVVSGTTYYAVTVANPVVELEADGTGTISATMSAKVPGQGGAADEVKAPKLVTVADITGSATTGAITTVTPAWDGVIAPGSQTATDLGIGAGKPLEGRSFHPEFIGNLPTTVAAHFYDSGTGSSNAKKPVAPATVVVGPQLTPVATGDRANGLKITARGTDFTAVTNPGDAGVYVALVKAGTVVNYADRNSLASMPGADYVLPSRFQGPDFTAVINVPTEKLEVGAAYELVTWQAHTHSNTTQDTRTAVSIDWTKFAKYTPAITGTVVDGKLKVAVANAGIPATGNVVVKAAGTADQTVALTNGAAVASLPTAAGEHTVTVTYAGDANYAAGTATVKATVATVAPVAKVKAPTLKKAGKATVTFAGAKKGTKVVTTIKVPGVKKAVKVKGKTNAKGKVVVKLPKAKAKGKYVVKVKAKGFKAVKQTIKIKK